MSNRKLSVILYNCLCTTFRLRSLVYLSSLYGSYQFPSYPSFWYQFLLRITSLVVSYVQHPHFENSGTRNTLINLLSFKIPFSKFNFLFVSTFYSMFTDHFNFKISHYTVVHVPILRSVRKKLSNVLTVTLKIKNLA